MLKIRLQGTTYDIKWFLKILERNKSFTMNTPSDPQDIKGTNKYKRVYAEIYREDKEFKYKKKRFGNSRRAYGSGVTFTPMDWD